MNKKLTIEELMERHNQLLNYQTKVFPFTPTIREIQEVWGMNSTAPVRHTLDKLIELDRIQTRSIGDNKTQYYAV